MPVRPVDLGGTYYNTKPQVEALETLLRKLPDQELLARDLARLAFIALDGTPRSIPIGFTWNGAEIVMCTAKNARKLPALRRSPAVALTIDTESHLPKVLLIRGQAELDVVDGIPDEYFQWNGTYQMTPEQRAEWEGGVKSLYDGMVLVVVKPTWAELIDFETTLPTAIEELAAATAFFVALGLELEGEATVEGSAVDRLVGLEGVRSDIAMMCTPDGHGRLELTKYHTPSSRDADPRAPANTLGMHRIMFAVEDIDDILDRLRPHGAELVGELVRYKNSYRLCYLRGPAGIIVALAEQTK